MIRKIIQIDEEKCNGCGACAAACHEGAIGMVNGKAKLLRDDYCDGLGDCLPACPMDAIHFVEREAAAYDEKAVQANKAKPKTSCGCAGSTPISFDRTAEKESDQPVPSRLKQWPVQIKLAPIRAPYFDGADLLLAADCAAYAYGDFHNRFIRNRVVLVGCPKLDQVDYAEKLGEILKSNDIRSVVLTRMTVPCCGGLEHAIERAIEYSGKAIPLETVIIAPDGCIVKH